MTYRIGDEVTVNGHNNQTRPGKVVAVLGYPDLEFPVVVEHKPFGDNGGTIYQRFSPLGRRRDGLVTISPRKEYRILPIMGNPTPNTVSSWYTEEGGKYFMEVNKKRGRVKGFLQGELNPITQKIENIKYTSLED